MQSRSMAVTYDTKDKAHLAQFLAAMLGREPIEDFDGVVLAGADGLARPTVCREWRAA